QHPARALEPGGVDQLVEQMAVHTQRVALAVTGGARLQGDGDGVVLRKRGDDTRLALVGMADHGEAGSGGHEDTSGARHRRRWGCCRRSTNRRHWARVASDKAPPGSAARGTRAITVSSP